MENAHLYFPFEEDDDLYDLYEERLFEDKQFFTSRAIFDSVFKKRLEKMGKREKAFRFLTQSKIPEFQVRDIEWQKSSNLPEAYRAFQSVKSILFQEIYTSKTVGELMHWVKQLMQVHQHYVAQMASENIPKEEIIFISKEPEPTELSQAILSFEKAGGKTILDIETLTFEGKEILLAESKRLSLWRQKEMIDGKF